MFRFFRKRFTRRAIEIGFLNKMYVDTGPRWQRLLELVQAEIEEERTD